MNEQLEALWNRLRRKVDQVVIVTLVILFGVVLGFYWLEQQASAPEIPNLPPPQIPPAPPMWDELKRSFTNPEELAQTTEFAGLLDFNPFDARSVADVSEKVVQLDKEYEVALQAFLDDDIERAKRICTNIIQQMPSHQKTIGLLKQISEKEKGKQPEIQPTNP